MGNMTEIHVTYMYMYTIQVTLMARSKGHSHRHDWTDSNELPENYKLPIQFSLMPPI